MHWYNCSGATTMVKGWTLPHSPSSSCKAVTADELDIFSCWRSCVNPPPPNPISNKYYLTRALAQWSVGVLQRVSGVPSAPYTLPPGGHLHPIHFHQGAICTLYTPTRGPSAPYTLPPGGHLHPIHSHQGAICTLYTPTRGPSAPYTHLHPIHSHQGAICTLYTSAPYTHLHPIHSHQGAICTLY